MGGAPFFQRFDGYFEQFAGALEIAVVLIDLVEGIDFGVEGVSSFHGLGRPVLNGLCEG